MASTKFFTTTVETVTQLIVTSSLSQALHGLWCCHGPLEIEVFQNAATLPSRQTRQWTRTPKTGISTDWVWPEWDHYRQTPPTGEQHAAIRLTASISQTTSAETSRTSTSWIILGEASAGEWNTSTSGGTWARIWRYLSFSIFMKACILTVHWGANSKRQGLALWEVKIILVGTITTTLSFVAQRIPSPPPSGGLELISSPSGDKIACTSVRKCPGRGLHKY